MASDSNCCSRSPTNSSISRAWSRTRSSSRLTRGSRTIEPKMPAFIRACWPTMTFSTAVIVANRRMFWNVRATPALVMRSGRARVTSLASKVIRPALGLYSPVSMLKNVVLPAPLGPMIETIDLRGIANETSLTATRPPKIFDTRSAVRMSPFASAAIRRPSGLHLDELLVRADALLELELAPSLGQEALRSEHHHDHQQEAEDPERQVGQVEVQAERARQSVERVGDEAVVDERQDDGAEGHPPDRPDAAEDDHRQDEDREREGELVGVDSVQIRAQERARHAAERRAGRVGQQLGAD